MEAKEKAQLLFNQMLNTDLHCMTKYCAKKCALIAVEEIMKVLWHTHNNESEYRYWEKVKQEINNL